MIIVAAVILFLTMDYYLPVLFGLKYKIFNNNPKMLLVWRNGLGERELGARIIKIMPTLGVNIKFVRSKQGLSDTIFDRHVHNHAEIAANYMQPDLILTIDRELPPMPQAPNFVVLDQGVSTYIGKNADNKDAFLRPYHYEFTGLLPAFKEIELLKEVYEANGKPFYGFNWRPTVHRTAYKYQANNRLFYAGGVLTGPVRQSQRYKDIFKLLDQTGYLDIYGAPDRWQHTPNSIRGFVPIDGESLLKVNNQCGVSLILHDHEHLHSGTPTGRIFESAASNTVIISDRNKFVIENFGDNVLYLDVDQDGHGIFKQIDQHMQWINEHPEQARQMAERCHAIFLEKFTLEEQMQKLIDLAASLPIQRNSHK